jgi:hypothetical protein
MVGEKRPFQLDNIETMRVLATSLFLVPFVLLIEYVIFFPDPFPKLGVEVLVAVASYIAALFLFKTLRKKT